MGLGERGLKRDRGSRVVRKERGREVGGVHLFLTADLEEPNSLRPCVRENGPPSS